MSGSRAATLARGLVPLAVVVGLSGLVSGCATPPPPPPSVVPRLSPREEIVQFGTHWISRERERRLPQAPTLVVASTTITTSELSFQDPAKVVEGVSVSEHLSLEDGTEIRCESRASVGLEAHFSTREGRPIVELSRPATQLIRNCSSPPPPGFTGKLPASRWVVVLREERLVVVEPAADRRQYLASD